MEFSSLKLIRECPDRLTTFSSGLKRTEGDLPALALVAREEEIGVLRGELNFHFSECSSKSLKELQECWRQSFGLLPLDPLKLSEWSSL